MELSPSASEEIPRNPNIHYSFHKILSAVEWKDLLKEAIFDRNMLIRSQIQTFHTVIRSPMRWGVVMVTAN